MTSFHLINSSIIHIFRVDRDIFSSCIMTMSDTLAICWCLFGCLIFWCSHRLTKYSFFQRLQKWFTILLILPGSNIFDTSRFGSGSHNFNVCPLTYGLVLSKVPFRHHSLMVNYWVLFPFQVERLAIVHSSFSGSPIAFQKFHPPMETAVGCFFTQFLIDWQISGSLRKQNFYRHQKLCMLDMRVY